MPPKYTPEEQNLSFWNSIAITADDNQCWLWLKGTSAGYGSKKWYGVQTRAHRIAWMYPNYVIPDGMEICHSCDNPLCCNPKHLFIGTRQDNVDDMYSKGRQAPIEKTTHRGEEHGSAKLTLKQVEEIRSRFSQGNISKKQLSKEYHVSDTHIGHIINNRLWKQ